MWRLLRGRMTWIKCGDKGQIDPRPEQCGPDRAWPVNLTALPDHYKHHWFPLMPSKGSGYRCIRINHKMDPLIGKAAGMIGLSHQRLFQLLPSELTLWIDPFEVSYRIGEDGSICVLYESPPPGLKTAKALESRNSCKDEWRIGRSSPSKNYNMMTVSS
uniref:Protein BTG1-like n=1 Tax=Gopherus evgoodei TaxID=1825980 RepID=A0A8C4Y5I2_9SAUR